jgi:hypothetical protein
VVLGRDGRGYEDTGKGLAFETCLKSRASYVVSSVERRKYPGRPMCSAFADGTVLRWRLLEMEQQESEKKVP